MLEVTVADGAGGVLSCTFFNQAWRERDLRVGRWGLFAGKVTEFRGKRQLNGPEYVLLGEESSDNEIEEFAGALIPIYPAAAAVPTWMNVPAFNITPPPTYVPNACANEQASAGVRKSPTTPRIPETPIFSRCSRAGMSIDYARRRTCSSS